MDDLLGFLVGLADHVFADALGIDERRLHDLAVGTVVLGLFGKALVVALQLLDLPLQPVHLVGAGLELLLHAVQKPVDVLDPVTAEALFKLDRVYVLRCQHTDFLLSLLVYD